MDSNMTKIQSLPFSVVGRESGRDMESYLVAHKSKTMYKLILYISGKL